MCWTTRTGSGNPAGNRGKIAPNAVGPPVETPITTTFGRTFMLCQVGVARQTVDDAGMRAGSGRAAALVCPGIWKNCLIFGSNSSRSRVIERYWAKVVAMPKCW